MTGGTSHSEKITKFEWITDDGINFYSYQTKHTIQQIVRTDTKELNWVINSDLHFISLSAAIAYINKM